MKRVFLDTETTGLTPDNGDRVVEIAAIIYDGLHPVAAKDGGEYHRYINPERDMPAEAYEVHGLSREFLADKPLFSAIVDSFIEFIRDKELIIHNAEFDCNFLNAELARLGKPPLADITTNIICSLQWSRENNHQVNSHSLDALCRHFNINAQARKQYHSAIIDTRLLGEVYFRMQQRQTEIDMRQPASVLLVADSTTITIPRRRASAEELAAHQKLLNDMANDTNTPTLYQQLATTA